MNVKETLEQCLHAGQEVKKVLFLVFEYHSYHISSRSGGKRQIEGLGYIGAIADQEIKALEHDLKELEKEEQ